MLYLFLYSVRHHISGFVIAPIVPHIFNPLSDTNLLNYIFYLICSHRIADSLNDRPG